VLLDLRTRIPPRAKLDKLDALLAKSFMPREDAGLLTEMLSVPNDGRYPTLELAPQQRRQKTLEALTAQMEAAEPPKAPTNDLRGCSLG
jgi:hypothetical protein